MLLTRSASHTAARSTTSKLLWSPVHRQDWASAPITPAAPCWTLRGSVVDAEGGCGPKPLAGWPSQRAHGGQSIFDDPVAVNVRQRAQVAEGGLLQLASRRTTAFRAPFVQRLNMMLAPAADGRRRGSGSVRASASRPIPGGTRRGRTPALSQVPDRVFGLGHRAVRVNVGVFAGEKETEDGTERKTVVAEGRGEAGDLLRASICGRQRAVARVDVGLVAVEAIDRYWRVPGRSA